MSESDTDEESDDNGMHRLCFVCGKPVESEIVVPGQAALETIIKCSKERGDGKWNLLKKDSKIIVHRSCRNKYTHCFYVSKSKRERPVSEDDFNAVPKKPLRSLDYFDFDGSCFLCSKKVEYFLKKTHLRRQIRVISCDSFRKLVETTANKRKDEWGLEVYRRISTVNIEDEQPKYHYNCWTNFKKATISTPGRPKSEQISRGMEVVYKFIEESDDCQFSIRELSELVSEYGISIPTIKTKLREHYGNEILITSDERKRSIICFRNTCEQIISDRWYEDKKTNLEDEEIRIVKKAAEIVRKCIESTIYEQNMYNNTSNFFDNVFQCVPKPLQVFIDTVTNKKRRSSKSETIKKKCAVISHCLISLVKPNSFLSPILLGIASLIHQKVGSRAIIDILSNLGICSSYHDLKLLESSIIQAPSPTINRGTFAQFVFDNCDVNVNTIDGTGTFHNMAGIMCVTPAESIHNSGDRILKQNKLTHSSIAEKKGVVPVMECKTQSRTGMSKVKFVDLDELMPLNDKYNDFPTPLDVLWMFGKMWNTTGLPGWQGFLEKVTANEYSDVSRILQLPFIMSPPSDVDTVYTALMMAIEEGNKIDLKTVFVTFDLPLFMKAVDIVFSASNDSPLNRVIVRLGGFHLLMSFLGAIGFIMADSGIHELLSLVYANNTVKHILSGKAYARAIRAHFLLSTALGKLIIKDLTLTPEEEEAMKHLLQDFEFFPTSKTEVDDDIDLKNVVEKLKDHLTQVEDRGPTAKLWVQYLKMISLVKRFIEAERTGNWELHLYTVKLMIPYFIASGHMHYSKACLIYLQIMDTLPSKLNTEEYNRFVSGYCTIRRTNKYCSGTSPDMVIEQTANREFKVIGGIIRRGFTDKVLSAYVVTKPAFSDIVEGLEDFCGVRFLTSEQHVDSRESRVNKDGQDMNKLYSWLESQDPFLISTSNLVSLGTGVTGNDSINCHLAKEVGTLKLKEITGKQFYDVKFKRSDNVRPLSAVNSSITVHDRVVNVDPLILYQRMLLKRDEDLSKFFKYEIAPYPLSLFTSSGMRKNVKSALYDEFESYEQEREKVELKNVSRYVIDGGHLIHSIRWDTNEKNQTYQDLCSTYVKHVQKKCVPAVTSNESGGANLRTVVVFDGYDDHNSIKKGEHKRRYKLSCPDVQVAEHLPVYANQARFLSNEENKKQFITLLKKTFQDSGVEVRQASGDADSLIVKTAIEIPSSAIVTQDTDILILTTALTPTNQETYVVKPQIGRRKQKVFGSKSLQEQHANVKDYILLAHAFSGCDSTSAIYGKGKSQLLNLFEKDSRLKSTIDIFNKKDSTKFEVKKAGETIFLFLYGSKDGNHSLDEFRYFLFQKSLKRNTAKLELLPPTSASAEQHSYRSYYQVQFWLGNELNPENWGWCRLNGYLEAIKTTIEPAPEAIMKMIFCSCHGTCSSSQCTCRRSGVRCSPLCKVCEGGSCINMESEKEIAQVRQVHLDDEEPEIYEPVDGE